MRQTSNPLSRLSLIGTLWGLLLTKCFTLEFFVRHYEVPINSLVYVWTLSIFMASVATAIYVNIEDQQRKALTQHPDFIIHLLAVAITVLLVAYSLLPSTSAPALSLALAAASLGISQILRPNAATPIRRLSTSTGWLLAGIAIIYFAAPMGFLIFASALFLLCVIPAAVRTLALRRQR